MPGTPRRTIAVSGCDPGLEGRSIFSGSSQASHSDSVIPHLLGVACIKVHGGRRRCPAGGYARGGARFWLFRRRDFGDDDRGRAGAKKEAEVS
jgi:hypothetical protein